jgi:hypothetical protein
VSDDARSDEAELAREVAARAIRRLNILEHVFLLVAAGAALLAGALVAWLLGQVAGTDFRVTWAISALLFFLAPAGLSVIRVRREEREWNAKREAARAAADGDADGAARDDEDAAAGRPAPDDASTTSNSSS